MCSVNSAQQQEKGQNQVNKSHKQIIFFELKNRASMPPKWRFQRGCCLIFVVAECLAYKTEPNWGRDVV